MSKNNKTKNMPQDKLFNVTITAMVDGVYKQTLGIVKAETMPEALQYIGREYPNYSVQAIEESHRVLL